MVTVDAKKNGHIYNTQFYYIAMDYIIKIYITSVI